MALFMSQKGDTQDCIQKCLKCYEVCTRTLAAGLEVNEDQDFITTLQLCAQSCQLSAQALLLDSEFHSKICALNADLCDAVADLCQDFDEAEMRECEHVAKACAKACRSLLPHGASSQSLQSDIRLV